MPANKMTQQEVEFFPDVAHGSQPALMEFLLIRNRLLQAWLADPTAQLTTEKAQSLVQLPQSGQADSGCVESMYCALRCCHRQE